MSIETEPLSERLQALVRAWKAEKERPFGGWDFSYLDGKWEEEQPPWDYVDDRAVAEAAVGRRGLLRVSISASWLAHQGKGDEEQGASDK